MGAPQQLLFGLQGRYKAQFSGVFDGSNDYGTKTPSAGNAQKFTLSWWDNRAATGDGYLIATTNNWVHYDASNRLDVILGNASPDERGRRTTTATYTATGTWGHWVIWYDSANATVGDRILLWRNGVQITAFDVNGAVTLNSNAKLLSAVENDVMAYPTGSTKFNGIISDFLRFDGQLIPATSLGETFNGSWVPKNPQGLTFGTQGFWFNFADSGAMLDDASGNGNDWTVAGAIAQSTDTP